MGVIAASTKRATRFPPNTESRIADFTELVATAVSNAEARADLVASRVRLLTAGDDARRRVARDLHDGAQQRLVHTILTLTLAQRAQEQDAEEAKRLVGEALEEAAQANAELRELAHGLLPAVLTRGGLAAGVESLVSRVPVPVEVEVCEERFAPEIEATAYFVVSEALTNVAKHSGAGSADVRGARGQRAPGRRARRRRGRRPPGRKRAPRPPRPPHRTGRPAERGEPPRHGTRLAATLPLRDG